MKTLLLTFLGILLTQGLSAQRNVDLKVNLLSPESGTEIHPMEPFAMQIQLKNEGAEPLLASDSLAIYLIMNEDTIPQMDGNYWKEIGIALASQEIQTITKMMAFDNSFLGAHVTMCIFVRPFNAINPVEDNLQTNNVSCTEIDVMEPVSGVDELSETWMNVYPNPVGETLFLDGEATAVTLTDYSGKVIVSKMENLSSVDCSGLQNGVYVLKISTKHGYFMKKIVVAH